MLKKVFLIFILSSLLFAFNNPGYSQQRGWRDYIEQMAEEGEVSAEAIDNIFEDLLYMESNPINLNSVTRDELERIPLLSLNEAESIYQFLKKNRPVMTLYELRNIPNLDYATIQLILPFFYVGDWERELKTEKSNLEQAAEILKNGRNEAEFRFDKTLTPRAGYGQFSDSILERYPNRKYCGEDFYTSLRYSFRYRNSIEAGLTAEKDAGEPFLKSDYPKGFDHYGVHLTIRDIGRLKVFALGDYRLAFGQGLILNNDFVGSKSWSTANVARRTLEPKRHYSTAESGYFKGAAATFGVGKFSITPFYSNKKIDANLSDSGDITSFKTDGLHRTVLEIEKKKNSREEVAGANINYRRDRFQAGVSGVYHRYNRLYNPTPQDYNLYYLRDRSNINLSLDYSYQLPGFIFAGETAIAKNGSVATLNSAQYRLSDNLSLSLLYRHYPVSYNALHGQAFSEGSRVQNESGLFIGTGFNPLRKISVDTYIDLIYFPWIKFAVDKPSKALDYYALCNYTLSRRTFFELRYRLKIKEKNISLSDKNISSVLPYSTNKLRLRYSHETENGWRFRTTADMALYSEKHSDSEKGFMLSQNINWRGNTPFTGNLYFAWFDAATYDVRLYSYEPNLLSTFYMPSFYGKGVRLTLSAKYKITANLTISIKAGHTYYTNRDTIGSGRELIIGSSRTDLFSHIKWKF